MSEISFGHYGEERERIATENELEIFQVLIEMTGRDDLALVRKSNNYVSACLGEWDLARFKYTPRAKWIQFPIMEISSVKHAIGSAEDVRQFTDEIKMSLDRIAMYN